MPVELTLRSPGARSSPEKEVARQFVPAGGPRSFNCGCVPGHAFDSPNQTGSEICARTIAICAIERVVAISALAEEDIRLHLLLRLDRIVLPPAGRPRRSEPTTATQDRTSPQSTAAAAIGTGTLRRTG